jgi:ABC-type Mn2+/Zn2+ transport system permease subunit
MPDFLFGPFIENGFMRLALASGVLAALACGIVGTWMVLRGLSFIGDALAHGVLPGVAGALLVGAPGLAGAGVGALAMIGGIALVQRRTRLGADTAIGLLFVGMLALGVAMVSRSGSFSGDLVKILFGEVLGVAPADLAPQAVCLGLLAALAWVLRRPFLLLCFSPEHARVSGYDPKRLHTLMLLLIGSTVIVSFQTVGTLLVFGLLVAPAATAAVFVHRMGPQMLAAGLLGSFSVWAGLLLSYHGRLAAGACIILVAVGLFFAALLVEWLGEVLGKDQTGLSA